MPFQLLRKNIISISVDAIVNPTDSYYSHTGGVDKQIHEAAGSELYEECKKLGELTVSDAKLTSAFNMANTQYVIHTCGPRYQDGKHNENELLYNCYRNCLEIAKEKRFESIAFPLISSGTFGFPKGEALKIATKAIVDCTKNCEINVYLLVYDNDAFDTSKKLFKSVKDYLIKEPVSAPNRYVEPTLGFVVCDKEKAYKDIKCCEKDFRKMKYEEDVPFHIYLQKIAKEKNMQYPDIYGSVNMDRKLWNNIINGKKKGIIRKETAVSIALGLKLNLKETKELVERSGNSFGYSIFDKIITAAIMQGEYRWYEINEVLMLYDQPTLGTKSND